jgi:5-formyltetrahydrofolate cyclo-ligase
MMSAIASRKQMLRREMRERQRSAAAEELSLGSARLCHHLRQQTLWADSRRVLLFSPLPPEPDIRPLLAEAIAAGKMLALPRYAAERGEYEARVVCDLASLQPGHFGILEPPPGAPPLDLILLDFLLVPGLAYDRDGRRLGRGKGYFDRLLAQAGGHKCGVAFDWQVVGEVPTAPHDIRVNSLLTPSGWIPCLGSRPAL